MIYRRGRIWWAKWNERGVIRRVSLHTTSRAVAEAWERAREKGKPGRPRKRRR